MVCVVSFDFLLWRGLLVMCRVLLFVSFIILWLDWSVGLWLCVRFLLCLCWIWCVCGLDEFCWLCIWMFGSMKIDLVKMC